MKYALAFVLFATIFAAPPGRAGQESLADATVTFPNRWSVSRGQDSLTARTPNNSMVVFASAQAVAPEWVAMADRPGTERDGLFDALTERAVLAMVKFVLNAGAIVINLTDDPDVTIEKDRGFVFAYRAFGIQWGAGGQVFNTNFTVNVGIDSEFYYEVITGIEAFASAQDVVEAEAIFDSIATSSPFAIEDAQLGSVVARIQGGQVSLKLDIERTEDLVTWFKAGEVTASVPVQSDAEFFRFRLSP